jgi:fermentation-respiration switch protein FrsA (DUF1100 family)
MRRALAIVSIFRLVRSLIFALLCAVVLSGCTSLLFYPMKPWVRTPSALGIEYEDIELMSADGTKLSAWWLEAEGEVNGTVIFFHGNAENISTHLGSVYWLPERGYQVMLLDYRGYGRSQGKPGIPEIFDDIAAGLEWTLAEPRAAGKPVFMLGQSLGAAMSGYVIANRPDLRQGLTAVALDAAFASYSDIAKEVASRNWLTWSFQYPAAWAMPNDYDLIDYIGEISPTPVLIIHGTADEIIPFSNGEALFDAAGDPKNFLRYDGPHIQTFRDLELRTLVLGFFNVAATRQGGDGSQPETAAAATD